MTTRQAYAQVQANALRTGKPSAATLAILDRYDLDPLVARQADEVVRQLHEKAMATGERELLFALAETSYVAGEQIRRSLKPWEPRDARDYYLGAAVYAWLFLFGEAKDPPPGMLDRRIREACDLYNIGLGLALTKVRGTNGVVLLEEGRRQLPVGAIELKFSLTNYPTPLEDYEQFLLADQFRIRGLSVRNREPGVGVPLVAVWRFDPELGVRRCSPVTVFARLPDSLAEVEAGTNSGVMELHSAFDDTTVTIGSQQVPLETDLTTHGAFVLNQSYIWDLGRLQFLAPARQVRSQLLALQPVRHDRIPVVLVHGTFSSPIVWAEFNNTLAADQVLRQRYQFWSFMYGSGNALPISAGELRDALTAKVNELDPKGTNAVLRQMVVIGHSQGGLLTKLTATKTGDRIWQQLSDKPLEESSLSEEQRERLRHLLFLEPLPFVDRVIFISTPHHGSYLATGLARRLASKLMSLPSATLTAVRDVTTLTRGTEVERMLKGRLPTSLDSMSPKNPVLLALADIPVDPTIKAHSIIPVLGDGDYHEGRDGLVTYQSAHVDYVESEFIVRGKHSCQNMPATIEEVRRILHLHLNEMDAGQCGNQSQTSPDLLNRSRANLSSHLSEATP